MQSSFQSKDYPYLSEIMLKAIKFSSKAHQGQDRRDNYPFISHPFAVGLALAQSGCSEDVVVAGILHDTIEDTSVVYEDIVKAFGVLVADLVQHVSYDQSLPSQEGKELYLQHLQIAPQEALAISAADLLANRTDTLLGMTERSDWVQRKFSLERTIAYDRRRIAIIRRALNNSLIDEAESVVNKVHGYLISK